MNTYSTTICKLVDLIPALHQSIPQAAARRPAQLVLFRIAVPTTPAQTVSWSIPITKCSRYSNGSGGGGGGGGDSICGINVYM